MSDDAIIGTFIAAVLLLVTMALAGCGESIYENHRDRLRVQKNACESVAGMAAVPMVDTSGRIHYFKCEQRQWATLCI